MSQDNKIVLVLEKSSENLKFTKEGEDVVLEGIFAQFGVVNNNQRVYEENEYLPHLEYLSKKINENRLLGELDHPEKFDISLSKVSHVVEKLEYDKEKRQIKGRVKLLDTPSGRIAKQLVESGVPISISSRAAGLVESDKKVKIKKIFTYDLVADPGFENAVLTRMNESLGILNENVAVYDVTSEYPDLLESFKEKKDSTSTNKTPESMDYVTSEEMNTYSLVIKEEIEEIHKKVEKLSEAGEINEQIKMLTESLDKMKEQIDLVSESIEKTGKHHSSLSEKLDKVVDYTDYVAKTLDESIEFTKHVAERTDQSIQYGEYLKEQIMKGIEYAEYLKECIEQGVSYAEYVGNKVDESIKYTESVGEKVNESIKYTEFVGNKLDETLEDVISYSEYLKESLNEGIGYAEYVGEQTQHLADYTEYMLNENKGTQTTSEKINENEKLETTDYSSLNSQVDQLIESIKKQKVDEAGEAIMEAHKKKVSEALNESSQKRADSDLNKLFTEAQKAENPGEEKWITEAPEEYKTLWESLEPKVKNSVYAQSKLYKLDTPYQIKNFWETRSLEKKSSEALNESKAEEIEKPTNLGYSAAYLENISKGLDKFGKK